MIKKPLDPGLLPPYAASPSAWVWHEIVDHLWPWSRHGLLHHKWLLWMGAVLALPVWVTVPPPPVKSGEVIAFVTEKGGLEYAAEVAEGFAAKAVASISTFPESAAKKSLLHLVDFVMKREY